MTICGTMNTVYESKEHDCISQVGAQLYSCKFMPDAGGTAGHTAVAWQLTGCSATSKQISTSFTLHYVQKKAVFAGQ